MRLSKFISAVFHPLLMPFWGVLGWSYLPFSLLSKAGRWVLLGYTLFLTLAAPGVVIWHGLRTGAISDLRISRREERPRPFLAALVGYVCWFFIFWRLRAYLLFPFHGVAFGAMAAIVLVMLINCWWKISAHLTAMGGLCGGAAWFFYQLGIYPVVVLLALVLLSGLMVWARVTINHTPAQTLAGWLLGCLCVVGGALLFC